MSDDFTDLLELFKQRRRNGVRQLAFDDAHATAAELANIQCCIVAIEAVIAEAKPSPEEVQGFVDNMVTTTW
jgi:hypothetical protein